MEEQPATLSAQNQSCRLLNNKPGWDLPYIICGALYENALDQCTLKGIDCKIACLQNSLLLMNGMHMRSVAAASKGKKERDQVSLRTKEGLKRGKNACWEIPHFIEQSY